MRLLLAFAVATALGGVAGARQISAGEPYTYRKDKAFSLAESERVIKGLRAAPGVKIRVKEFARIDGRPMYRVDIEPPRRPGDPPIRIGMSAGVHYEPTAVRVLHQVMTDAAAGKAGHVAYSFYPIVNPAAQAGRKRSNDQGTDVNRTFLPGRWSPESAAMRKDLKGRHFARFYDLHGSREEGFFVIGGGAADARESTSAMRALPRWLRLTTPAAHVYEVGDEGSATSHNQGTLRSFLAQKGVRAFTVEYPRRASARWQQQGMRRLVDSLIRHAVADERSKARAPRAAARR